MVSPIYYFTRSGCNWCKKMQPSIEQINTTLSDEQKIQIHNIDEEKSKVIYENIIRINRLQSVVPLMYNSNIGTSLLGYKDKKVIQKFLRAEPISTKQPLTPLPHFQIENSSGKDFDNWKKSVILWYKENESRLPTNVIDKEKMIDLVYKQFMAHRTKPTTVESRLEALENKVDQILKKLS